MKKTALILSGLAMVMLALGVTVVTSEAQGPPPREVVWEGCELYETVVTPAVFNPPHGNFDELYVNPHGFKDGYNLVSDAAPGTAGYNGGRWHKNVLKDGVDPSKYMNACSVDDLDLDDFESTDEYFECPMLPRRGNR